MDKNSMNPLYFGKKGKSLFARDLREGPRDGDRDGHRTGPRSQISKEDFRVGTSFTISVSGAVARGLEVLESHGRVSAIITGVPESSGVRGLGGGQGAGGHGTAGAQNPAPLGAGAEGGDGESGSRGTVWHKSWGAGTDTMHP